MSGAGRKHRAKHLCQMHTDESYDLQDGESIVRLLELRGNHYRVVNGEGAELLVRLPAKFNRVVWMKKDDLIVIAMENATEGDTGVVGLITHRLSAKQIKRLIKEGDMPESFITIARQIEQTPEPIPQENPNVAPENEDGEEESDSDEDDMWTRGNPNVAPTFDDFEEDEESEEEE